MDINHLLGDLGIDPSKTAGHPNTASQVKALAPKVSQVKQKKARSAVSPQARLDSVQTFLDSRKATVDPVFSLQKVADDSSAWDAVGGVFKKALEIVDLPRSYVVSGVKELSDLGNEVAQGLGFDVSTGETGASWSDFVRQGNEHIGFGDVARAQSRHVRDGNKWIGRGIGFAGDVAFDPLTYTSMGAATGDKALETAVKAGGRKEVSEAVARKVVDSGLEGSDNLIADAARRGRGALTKKGLERSGSTELAKALDIPELRYELLGAKIPGSTRVAEAIANTKGEIKEWLGGTRAAKILRGKRIPTTNGMLEFTNIIRANTGNPEVQAAAVKVMMNATERTAKVRRLFEGETRKLIKSDLGHLLKNPPEDLIHHAETLGDTPLNEWLSHMHEILVSHGVNVPFRENYVPHLVTSEARKLGKSDEVVRAVIDAIDKPESFQLARELQGTIAEENARFMAKHGIKLFEDDPAHIAVGYLDSAEKAAKRAQVQQGLQELGVASEVPTKAVTEHLDKRVITEADVANDHVLSTDVGKTAKQVVDETKASLKVADAQINEAAKAGVTLREQEAQVASAALKDRKAALYDQVSEIDRTIKDVTRQRKVAEASMNKLQAQLEAQTAKRDGWVKIVKDQRSPLRKQAAAKVRQLNKDLAKTVDDLANARKQVDYVMNEFKAPIGDRAIASRGFVQETKRLAAARDELQNQIISANAEHDALKLTTTPPGMGPLLSDAHVAEANQRIADIGAKVSDLKQATAITENIYDAVIAEKAALVPVVDDAIREIDQALGKMTAKKSVKTTSKLLEYGADVSENLRLSRELLEHANDPAAKLMAQFEASAAVFDAKVIGKSQERDFMQETINTMYDDKFRTFMKQFVADGHQRMNEAYQIPDWVDQALQAEKILNSPTEWHEWARGYDKTLNVLKGYMIARPGFIVRNMYSSLFNVYLEGGAKALESVREYKSFYKMWRKDPEGYLESATARWGSDKANLLDRALTAQSASGFGQAASEFHTGALQGMNANPFSADFAPIRATRKGNEWVEEIVRGGHAYDVLKRGGSDNLAIDTLEKWHFNYSDITTFDQQMKRIMPFWMFFSNNVALQAQTFPQILPKLNRTYFNAKRNLESGSSDVNEPKYFKDAFGIRLNAGGAGTSAKYLFPDLPSLQVVRDASSAIDSKGLSLVAQTSPPIKLVNDAILGDKNSFTGIPFQDKYQKTPFPLPDFLPGVDVGGNSGESVWTDRTKYAYENLLPTMSQVDRFGGKNNTADSILSFLGVGVRTNNDKTRKGEQLRRARAQKSELDRVRDLGRV